MNFQPFDFSVFNMRNSIAQSKATIPYMLNTNYEQGINNEPRPMEGTMYQPVNSYHDQAHYQNSHHTQNHPTHDMYIGGPQQYRPQTQTLQPPPFQEYQGSGQNFRSSSHYLSPISYQNYPGWN